MSSKNRHQAAQVAVVQEEPIEETSQETNESPATETTEVVQEEVAQPAQEAPAPTKFDPNELMKTMKNKSTVIRFLASQHMAVKDIHKMLTAAGWVSANGTPIRYQHVRNVLTQQVKKPVPTVASVQAQPAATV